MSEMISNKVSCGRAAGFGAIGFGCLILVVCAGIFLGSQSFGTSPVVLLAPRTPETGSASLIKGPAPTRAISKIGDGDRINLLVLGSDRRPSEKCPCRTDTMMIATLNPKNLTAGLVTIPRDLYVSIPRVGMGRINTANFYGELYKFPGKGPGLAKETVENNLARKMDYYVLVDFGGFRRIVDTLGGIYVDVPQAINDATYPDDNFGYTPVHIPAGRVHMNGEMALAYVRTRHQDNDFGRSKRQIQVLLAIRDRALRLDVLPRLPGLVQALWSTVETDLTPQEIIALARVAARVKPENIKTASIDQTTTSEILTSTGEDVLFPDQAKISHLIDQVIPLDEE